MLQLTLSRALQIQKVSKSFEKAVNGLLKNQIQLAKETLDSHLVACKKELGLKLTELFNPGYQGSLSNAAITWYKKLPEYTKSHMFDSNSNLLLSIVKDVTSYNDYFF